MNKKINVRVVKKTYNSKVGFKKSTHNVTSLAKNVYSYKFKNNNSKINVSARSGIIMARKLSDLLDVDTSNLQDNYVMLYDAESKKYKFYDPDELISKSLIDGLPDGFMKYLNDNLVPQSLIDAINDVYDYISNLTLGKLANVKNSVDNASDTFIVRYDEVSGKYEAVDPDEILRSAVDETGLPSEFIEYMNNVIIPTQVSEISGQLNNRISTLKLGDLVNVDDTNVLDKYIIMYNKILGKYLTVNPDEVLKASIDETTQEGLPDEFLDQLDVDLDNRIDFDGGEY